MASYAQRALSFQKKHQRGGPNNRAGESTDNLLTSTSFSGSISSPFIPASAAPTPSPPSTSSYGNYANLNSYATPRDVNNANNAGLGVQGLRNSRGSSASFESFESITGGYGGRMPSPTRASRHRTTMSISRHQVGTNYGPYSYEEKPLIDAADPSDPSEQSLLQPVLPLNIPKKKRWGRRSNKAAVETVPHSTYTYTTTGLGEPIFDEYPEPDDALHRPDLIEQPFILCSTRGWLNALTLFVIAAGVFTLFPGFFIYTTITMNNNIHSSNTPGFGLGGINASGQIPDLPNLPTLIDKETPKDVFSRTGSDGNQYNLVFSDEFNTDGRTFYAGDDPYWEAQDFNYWATGDLEWYDPEALVTQNGSLVITISKKDTHGLKYQSGMLQSWNKFCFTTGYIEVSVSLPGNSKASGFWPAVWTMGNLGRAGFGATTEGGWPYTYDSCDVGTFPNQLDHSHNPASSFNPLLSGLPGQRLSACTCPSSASEHPGPTVSTGRGVPEIDILEAQVDESSQTGSISQSYQMAPFTTGLNFGKDAPESVIHTPDQTVFNGFKGTGLQQSLSGVTRLGETDIYNGTAFATYGYEWWSDPGARDEGYITWYSEGQERWTLTAGAIKADPQAEVGDRLISEEPMYIIMNLGLSPSFQNIDFANLQFPAMMYIDYVRVYQREGVQDGVGCDPKARPTADFINNHPKAYGDSNATTWAQAGYEWPKNSKYDGC